MCMNIYSIYKITCLVNLKVYIGFTSQDVNTRFKEHLKESKKTHDLRKFYCAIRKHGSTNFVYETIYQSYDKVYTHEVMEDYFINLYNSLKHGYNSVKGGHGHITRGRTKSVDLYGPGNVFICTFPTVKSCAAYLNTNPAIISSACKNATLNKGSQVKGHWVCYSGFEPVYKVPNNRAGCESARVKNTGRSRPEHSSYMTKRLHEQDKLNVYNFVHSSGEIFTGSRRELMSTYPEHNINNSMLGNVVSNKAKSHRGWQLRADAVAEDIRMDPSRDIIATIDST